MKTEIITVDTNNIESIKKAERKKAKLENAGYTLINESAGFSKASFVYQKKGRIVMKATMEFNRVSNTFDVWKGGQVIAMYKNWTMAQYRVKYENEGV